MHIHNPTISPVDDAALSRRNSKGRWRLLFGLVLLLVSGWSGSVQAQSQLHLPYSANGREALCRFGVNVTQTLKNYRVQPLRFGWYVDYQARPAPSQRTWLDYYPIIALEQTIDGYNYSIGGGEPATPEQLAEVIDTHPGAYWLIGNEPDRRFFQNDMEPDFYAEAYHDLYTFIKGRDPDARIVAGNIVQPTPLRLEYLDRVLAAYSDRFGVPMPVDAWGFHNFVLNEASCTYYAQFFPGDENGLVAVCWGADIPPGLDATDGLRIDVQDNDDMDLFKQQVVAFRTWLAANGYQHTPVFLTEFGVLMPPGFFSPDFDAARVNAFMSASFDYLLTAADPDIGYPADDNRLVQRFSWYSTDEDLEHNGYLFERTAAGARTPMGDNYVAYTAALAEEVDVAPLSLQALDAPAISSRGATTVTLEAVIVNSGNLAAKAPVEARFYNGDPDQGGSLIGVDDVSVQGCAETTTARVEWGVPAAGDYTVYVRLATPALETDDQNNRLSQSFTFAETD